MHKGRTSFFTPGCDTYLQFKRSQVAVFCGHVVAGRRKTASYARCARGIRNPGESLPSFHFRIRKLPIGGKIFCGFVGQPRITIWHSLCSKSDIRGSRVASRNYSFVFRIPYHSDVSRIVGRCAGMSWDSNLHTFCRWRDVTFGCPEDKK